MVRLLMGWFVAGITPLLAMLLWGMICGLLFGVDFDENKVPPYVELVMLLLFLFGSCFAYAASVRHILFSYSSGTVGLIVGWLGCYAVTFIVGLVVFFIWMGLFKSWTVTTNIMEWGPLDDVVTYTSLGVGNLMGYLITARFVAKH
jgi:hypothetical protein